MNAPRKNRLTLRFEDALLEAAFRASYVAQSLKQVRLALLLGVVLYGGLFGLLDGWRGTHELYAIWAIRLGVCVCVLAVYAYSFAPSFRRWMQPVLSLVVLVAGLGLVAMMVVDDTGTAYYDGPVLLILPAYVLLRLRFVYATAAAWLVIAAYEVAVVWIEAAPPELLLSSSVFLIAANTIGMFAGYALESYARTACWQTRVIEEKRAENEQLLRMQSRFFANISHEFRTPLTLILGPLENLLETPEAASPDLQEPLGIIQANARRLLHLINQLLDLARLEAGAATLHARQADLISFLRERTHALSSYADRKNIDLQFVADADVPPLYFDEDKLDKVIVNLVSNALKFTPEGGTVRVSAAARNGEGGERVVDLSVRDTGRGIPAEALPYVFDRFQQAGPADAPGWSSTGIGLALVKELVHLHHGTVSVESEAGFGSTFTVTLPGGSAHLSPSERAAVGPSEDRPLPDAVVPDSPALASSLAAGETAEPAGTVLVVEDHPEMRAYVRRCLEGAYHVVEAAEGAAGLAAAREVLPDLVVSDVMMPEMDGEDLCRRLKTDALTDHIPVILLTARASDEDKLSGLETGADDYLTKPFLARELQLRVGNLIAVRRRLQQRFSQEVLVQPGNIAVPSADAAFIERACTVVEAHLGDAHFDVDAFAEAMGMSRRQLQRKLRALSGHTPNTFIRLLRLKRAAQLLEQQAGTVAEIAYTVGFNNPTYFTKCFGEVFGAPPSEYLARRDGRPE